MKSFSRNIFIRFCEVFPYVFFIGCMYIICFVFLYCILGSGVEAKFVFGVEFNNFCAIAGEMELFISCETAQNDTVTAMILFSAIGKSDVLLFVLLRELLKDTLFKEISDRVLSEVVSLLYSER